MEKEPQKLSQILERNPRFQKAMREADLEHLIDLKILKSDNDPKKLCFYKAKSEWTYPKPFEVSWGEKTSHLKKESDWWYLWSKCKQEEERGSKWSEVFWGSLKIKK